MKRLQVSPPAAIGILALLTGCVFNPATLSYIVCDGECEPPAADGDSLPTVGDTFATGGPGTCSDGARNQDETDVDCGGSCPLSCGVCQSNTGISVAECQVLQTLYESNAGASWPEQAGWMVTPAPCSWYGVTCGPQNITKLVLNSNNLVGSIPVELGRLTKLNVLSLAGNQLSGDIPGELAYLILLTQLSLHENELTGTIAPGLGELVGLTELSLHTNRLTGAIPSALGKLSRLITLRLDSNDLSGSIPSALGDLSTLTTLRLDTNWLTGTIPAELGALSGLSTLKLSGNQLSGAIPSQLHALSALETLALSHNSLTGFEPSALAGISSIRRIDVQINLFSQAAVDDALGQLYTNRMGYLYPDPQLNIGQVQRATNAAPSGTPNLIDPAQNPGPGLSDADWSWQGACHGPLSATAMVYALRFPLCDEDSSRWNIVHTP